MKPPAQPLDFGGIDPPGEIPPRKQIDVHGREEHEAILKDPKKCAELGLDIYYETMVYLNRWGGWLKEGAKEKDGMDQR